MTIQYPAVFLLLLPLLAWSFHRSSEGRAQKVLRILLYLLLVFALSAPRIRLPDRAGTLIVLADRSRSMPENAEGTALEVIRNLEKTRKGDSRLGVVSFAGDAAIEKLPEETNFDTFRSQVSRPDASNLAEGMKCALSLIPENAPGRILLLSDGRMTGADASRLFASAAARGIAVDYRMLRRQSVHDLAVTHVGAPMTGAPGEFFTISCRIDSPEAQNALCRIRRGNGAWRAERVRLRRGVNFVTWRDRAESPGILDYTISVTGENAALDEFPENNMARHLIRISGSRPLLLLSESPSGNLARVLREAGIPVVRKLPAPAELSAAKLAGYSGVILENVPASKLGLEGMRVLAGTVRSGALGLMMTGGRHSFAVGGYYRSPLEELLPVSMEQRREVRKSAVAVMVALDRSGSMSAPVGNLTKMALANRATLEVCKLLHPNDEFGVIAVDSSPHRVIPLAPLSEIRGAEGKILSIESMGGGIYTYTALHSATAMLLKSKAPTRHLLLFADAADAEEPGSYRALLEKTSAAGITISVVALGTESDPDAAFLRDVARRGNGICYFSKNADELPRIFAEDTFVMARSTFVEGEVPADYTNAVRSLSRKLGKSTAFGGYNLCYLKDNCENLLFSRDENHAPLAAIGQAGLGRVAVLTAEADGEYTGRFASDPDAGTLLAALANWMRADDAAQDFLVTQEQGRGQCRVGLSLDPARERDPWGRRPELVTMLFRPGEDPVEQRGTFEWITPDRMEISFPMEGNAVYLPTLLRDGARPLALAPVRLGCSPEFLPDSADGGAGDSMAELCALSRGTERFLNENVWDDLPPKKRLFNPVPWLLLAAVLLFLVEIADRRFHFFGLLSSRSDGRKEKTPQEKRADHPEQKRKRFVKRTAEKNPALPVAEESSPAVPVAENDLTEALRRARRH